MQNKAPAGHAEPGKRKYLEENVQDHVRLILSDIVAKRPADVLEHIITYCERELGIRSQELDRTLKALHTEENQPVIERPKPKALEPPQESEEQQKSRKSDKRVSESSKRASESSKRASESSRKRSTAASKLPEPPKENRNSGRMNSNKELRVSFAGLDQPETPAEPVNRASEVKKKSLLSKELTDQRAEQSKKTVSSFNSNEEISDTEFDRKFNLVRQSESGRMTRHGISAEASNAAVEVKGGKYKSVKKSAEEAKMIMEYLNKNVLFRELETKEKEKLVEAMEVQRFSKGKKVIKQGDNGNHLYIVAEGSLRCTRLEPGAKEETFLVKYTKGNVFGELAILYNTPRAATIEAETDAVCYSLDRETFNSIVRASVMKRHELFKELVQKVDILKPLSQLQKDKICDCLSIEEFRKGDYVISEGDEAAKLYFMLEGTAEALKKNAKGAKEKVFDFGANDYFGELALIDNDRRNASIRITSTTARLASLDKESFTRLLGDLKDILKQNSAKYEAKQSKKKP